jgi:hypothetical protein
MPLIKNFTNSVQAPVNVRRKENKKFLETGASVLIEERKKKAIIRKQKRKMAQCNEMRQIKGGVFRLCAFVSYLFPSGLDKKKQ